MILDKLMRCTGYILSKLDGLKFRYLTFRNNTAVNNHGGQVGGQCHLAYPKNITLGKNSYLNGGDFVASPHAKIVIGDNCLVSYNVHMRTDMHLYSDANIPINQQGHTEKDIVLGDDVWVGYGVQVMCGVTIADGCVIAAGAVVTKDTEPYGVYGGVPARLIKYRVKCTVI